METEKRRALDFIGGREKEITAAADRIWEFAELSMEETRSAALYGELLEEAGFKVEKNLCGIPTALSGSFGSGRPCIGILGEYDALSGLSQKAGQRAPEPVQAGGSGHGCGHNLLGAGALSGRLSG